MKILLTFTIVIILVKVTSEAIFNLSIIIFF